MTDHPSTTTPAGWYPAPDGSSESWWWDGAGWTQPQQATQSQPEQRPGAGAGATNTIARLATVTQVFILLWTITSVATIGVEASGITAVADFLNGSDATIDRLELYDQSTLVVSILSSALLIIAGVLWAIWQYRVAKQVAGQTRRTPGWHAGAWFVPIISLWFPYQNISDIWRAVGRTRPSWLIVWWLLWVVGNYAIQISSRVSMAAEGLEAFQVAMWLSIVGELLLLAAAPMAWLVVREITRGILQRASSPIASPVA